MTIGLFDSLKASAVASLWFSGIAALIACVPILFVFASSSPPRRTRYLIAGIVGAMAGEVSGVTSLFLSLWLYCRGLPSCNTAQGDMGLLVTLPMGTLAGCFLALFWTRAICRVLEPASVTKSVIFPSALRKWTCVALVPLAFWIIATLLAARLMA